MDLRLSMIIDAVDRFTEPMRRVTSTTERASEEMRETQQRLRLLSGTAGDIDNFRRLRTAQQQTSRQMEEAQQRVRRLAQEMRNSDRVTAAMRREFERARREASRLGNQHQSQQQQLQQLRNRLRDAGMSTSDLRNAQRRLREETERQNRVLQEQQQRLERLRNAQRQVSQSRYRMSQGAQSITGGATGMVAGAVTAFAMTQGAVESNNYAAILAAQQGLSSQQAAQYEEMMSDIRESSSSTKEEVFSSISAATAAFGGLDKASSSSIMQTAKQADMFRKIYAVDAAGSVQVVTQLMENGFAKSSTEAFDLLTKAYQSVSAEMRNELPEILNEYGKDFRGMGFSGSEAMALLVAASEKGKHVLDKTGDAVKEFSIRGSDMSKTSVDAYTRISLSAADMSTAVAKGGLTARLAMMQTAQQLLKIKDPAELSNTAIALFGTQVEDLGIENIPTFLKVLAKSGSDLGKFSGALDKAGNTIKESVADKMARAWNKFGEAKDAAIAKALPKLVSMLEKITTFMAAHPGLTSALMTIVAILGTMAIFGGAITLIVGGFTTLVGVVTLLKVKVLALNLAFLANPIIVGIVALVAAGYLLIKNWDGVKIFFINLWDKIKNTASSVWDFLKKIFTWSPLGLIVNNYGKITNFFSELISGIKNIFYKGFEIIKNIFISPIESVKNTLGGLWNKIFGGNEDKEIKATVKKTEEQIPAVKKVNQNYGYQPYAKPEIKMAQNVGSLKPSQKNNTINSNYNINIHSTSENPQDVAAEVRKQLDERDRQMATRNRGLLID